jgi:hypothetical protein
MMYGFDWSITMTEGTHVFLAIRPGQLHIASLFCQKLGGGSIVYCPADLTERPCPEGILPENFITLSGFPPTEEEIVSNPETVKSASAIIHTRLSSESGGTLYIPRFEDPGPYRVYAYLKDMPGLDVETYYEGIGSYTNPPGQIISFNPKLYNAMPESPVWSENFIGVRELDKTFNRSSHPCALSLDEAFPLEDEIPDCLKNANRIHISGPFSEKTMLQKNGTRRLFRVNLTAVRILSFYILWKESMKHAFSAIGVL